MGLTIDATPLMEYLWSANSFLPGRLALIPAVRGHRCFKLVDRVDTSQGKSQLSKRKSSHRGTLAWPAGAKPLGGDVVKK
jgi:hypothetical protein